MEISVLFPSDPEMISEKDLRDVHPFSTFNSQTERGRELYAIVAYSNDLAIGRGGDIPWHISEDFARFKQLTMAHPVIMGRKTWESLPKRPLPGRRNIVITRNAQYQAPGAEVASSIENAVASCEIDEVPFIIGGAEIYRMALPYCTKIYVTLVDTEIPDADAHFPELTPEKWRVSEQSEMLVSKSGIKYKFITYSRLG